eukprot:scaffold220343_cov25-Tisochrysis_lutea.AAC.1
MSTRSLMTRLEAPPPICLPPILPPPPAAANGQRRRAKEPILLGADALPVSTCVRESSWCEACAPGGWTKVGGALWARPLSCLTLVEIVPERSPPVEHAQSVPARRPNPQSTPPRWLGELRGAIWVQHGPRKSRDPRAREWVSSCAPRLGRPAWRGPPSPPSQVGEWRGAGGKGRRTGMTCGLQNTRRISHASPRALAAWRAPTGRAAKSQEQRQRRAGVPLRSCGREKGGGRGGARAR